MKLINKKRCEEALAEVLEETKQLNEKFTTTLEELKSIKSLSDITVYNYLEERKYLKKQKLLAKAYNNKGISFSNLDQYEKAIECYEKAIKLNPHSYVPVLNKGIALDDMGRHEDAIEQFDQIISDLEIIRGEDLEYLKEEDIQLYLDNLESIVPWEKTSFIDD